MRDKVINYISLKSLTCLFKKKLVYLKNIDF